MVHPVAALTLVALITAGGCQKEAKPHGPPPYAARVRPDEMPVLLDADLPFRYPPELYARRAQGNVTLSLFIDRNGRVAPDSTRIDDGSGFPAFDSAALNGASSLRFVPAKLHSDPIPLSILFPVYFRHPEARPFPDDSLLRSAAHDSDEG